MCICPRANESKRQGSSQADCSFHVTSINAPTARLQHITRQVGLRAYSGQFLLPNHTHLPINRDSGIREDSGLNIPLRGQLRTWLGLTEFPVMPIARPPNEKGWSIETEGLDATPILAKWL